jgi:copper chaperone
MEKVTLTAPDIACHHCEMAIKKALGGLDGISTVDVAIDSKKVTVQYDPAKVSLDKIEQAMAEEGYPVAK